MDRRSRYRRSPHRHLSLRPARLLAVLPGTLKSLYPGLTSVGEVSDGDPTITAFYAGGRSPGGIDTHLETPFDYPIYYTLLDVLVRGKPMSALENTLRLDWLYPHPEALVPFIGNHDQVRFLSLPGASPALLRLGFGLIMTLRGMPELYAGDEIGMLGGEDPDNRRDFPGGFPGDPRNAFTPGGRSPDQAAIHDWLAALGKLRAGSPALQTGRMQTILATDTGFAYLRTLSPGDSACATPGAMLVALNRSSSPQTLTLPVEQTAIQGCHTATPGLGDGAHAGPQAVGSSLTLPLPANGFAVYTLN